MWALAIDYWDSRCWIAVEIEGIAIAKEIVPRIKIISKIKKYCKDYNCDTIVVWLPYDLYWKNLKQLNKTKKFVNNLKELFKDKKIETVDERFTSFEADNILKDLWFKETRNKKDDISAQIILDTFLYKSKA